MKQIDKGLANPRMQCSVCGRWMRLHGKRLEVVNGKITEVAFQRFYGGCSHNAGNDHLAGDHADVCDVCCNRECKRLSDLEANLPDDVVAANVAFASRFD